jgi:hypothetical protein
MVVQDAAKIVDSLEDLLEQLGKGSESELYPATENKGFLDAMSIINAINPSQVTQAIIHGKYNPERLHKVIEELKHNNQNPSLYKIAMSEVASLSSTLTNVISMLDSQDKSLSTLRRYERLTRSTLNNLLEYLKKEEENSCIVGSFLWDLKKGESWVLGPGSVFLSAGVSRDTLFREVYMRNESASFSSKALQSIRTSFKRWITGETCSLDYFVAIEDNAKLGISSEEIGGNLYEISLERSPIIARKEVYFGSQEDVLFRAYMPIKKVKATLEEEFNHYVECESLKNSLFGHMMQNIAKNKFALRQHINTIKNWIYGPGWIYQRFDTIGPKNKVLFQIDGDMVCEELNKGEKITLDPRNAYAWDSSVEYSIKPYGKKWELFMRGTVPYHVEFSGPGRVWLSDKGYSSGYVGLVFTPAHWVYTAIRIVDNLFGYLNPLRYLE